MIVFPNCKINLGLRILQKRTDGYHDLETVFYPVAFTDVLEIIRSLSKETTFTTSGLPTETGSNNLCIKAYDLLKKDFPELPAIAVHLHKVIPSGAGLGGGSADASFTLKLLNNMFNLGLLQDQLIDYALQLGSDCPFFILNKPCYATGRGERLEKIAADLSGFDIVIVNPGIHISTAKAFSGVTPAVPSKSAREIISRPVETWKDELINDFEQTVFTEYPAIQMIKEKLYEKGAVYASMSGTGSTVYGLFPKTSRLPFSFPAGYFVKRLPG